ncbi:double-stranded RNA-specific editase 1 isoform X4 [Brachionus plicatilis]|uniref:Double-stranded RNA-specific editase 1 isoform X4 n=1 Tax=Brachionus plicatilis TaxID=10195 RepID=A0A3M7REP4_BRAPC|nr:double-stranded RNA-specific editase 1 isoform X4 [Brachionus plicatilis]
MFCHKTRTPTALTTKSPCFKRIVSKMSVDLGPATKRKLEPDSDLSQILSKKFKTSPEYFPVSQNYKNSIQYIHEIARIQPIKFELICQAGQAHKPTFKFCLNIQILGNLVSFYSTGPSKKVAKVIASLKAISYLIKLPDFFSPTEIEYFHYFIDSELQVNKLDANLLDDTTVSSFEESESSLVIDLPGSQSDDSSSSSEFDLKTKEIIATRNPLTILNHLLPKKPFIDNLIEESGQSHSKIFKVEIRLNKKEILESKLQLKVDVSNFVRNDDQNLSLFKDVGDEFIFYGIGSTKKIAKSRAAQYLLEILFNIKLTSPETELAISESHSEETGNKFKEFADSISELINQKYKELVEQLSEENEFNPNKFLNVYSGIVQSNGININTAKLICLTTGTKCIGGDHMSLLGTSLNDCHAEILAVRVLKKYLFAKLEEFIKNNFSSDIFELNVENSLYRLKENVQFHLFISSAPCGDSRIFSISDNLASESADSHPNRKVRGLLRTKIESGMGTIPVRSCEQIQTWDGIMLGDRLKVMSCSDKLCKYNVLGIQGALLSQLIEPVYFNSVIIGAFYNKNHLSRALFTRISQCQQDLPSPYKVNKPILSSITNSLQRQTSKPSTKSLIWSDILKQIEIINCKTGKKNDGSHSEVCQYEIFTMWISLINLVKEKKINFKAENQLDQITYNQAKQMALDYQKAKLNVYKCFKEKNLGNWLTAPLEQNLFTISLNPQQ